MRIDQSHIADVGRSIRERAMLADSDTADTLQQAIDYASDNADDYETGVTLAALYAHAALGRYLTQGERETINVDSLSHYMTAH